VFDCENRRRGLERELIELKKKEKDLKDILKELTYFIHEDDFEASLRTQLASQQDENRQLKQELSHIKGAKNEEGWQASTLGSPLMSRVQTALTSPHSAMGMTRDKVEARWPP